MKRGILKCAMSFAITIVMVLGMIPTGEANVVEAEANTVEVKISEYQDGSEVSLLGTENFVILLDEEKTVSDFFIKTTGSVSIKGDKKLTITGESIGFQADTGSLTLEEGVDINCSAKNFKLYGGDFAMNNGSNLSVVNFICEESNVTLRSGSNLSAETFKCYGNDTSVVTFEADSNIKFPYYTDDKCIYIHSGSFISAGNIWINYSCFGLTLRCRAVISGGNINVKCWRYAIEGSELNITGGNINLHADDIPLYGDKLNISGGNIKLIRNYEEPTGNITEPHTLKYYDICIADNMEVTEPENYILKDNYLYDSDGNEPQMIFIFEKEVKQDDGSSSNNGNDSDSGNNGNSGNAGGNNSGNDGSNNGNSGNDSGSNSGNNGGSGNSGGNNSGNNNSAGNAGNEGNTDNTQKYCNEWVDGRWYNADGVCDYEGILSWKCNSTGWWVEDTLGWYPQSQWQKIDGKWYYFLDTGYMDYSEYRDGYWLGSDGAWVEDYYGGHWCSDSTGWWYEDSSGWYPTSQWLWIDGKCYYFEADGYLFED